PVGGERKIHFRRIPGSRDALLWGTIPLRDRGQEMLLGIDDPARFAAMALRKALGERGVAVGGSAVSRHAFPDEIADLTQAARADEVQGLELARRTSPPLVEDLRI